MEHLTPSTKALAATRRSHFLPFRFSMRLLPWTQAVLLSSSATSWTCTLQRETHPGTRAAGSQPGTSRVASPKPRARAHGLSAADPLPEP